MLLNNNGLTVREELQWPCNFTDINHEGRMELGVKHRVPLVQLQKFGFCSELERRKMEHGALDGVLMNFSAVPIIISSTYPTLEL